MNYIQALILGLVQGLAEFLPVSSSGHLAILQNWFSLSADDALLLSVLLHVGTLISVCFCFGKDIWALIIELGRTIADLFMGKGLQLKEKPLRKFGVMIIVATIPTAIIGFIFEDLVTRLFSSLIFVAIGLILTGIILYVSDRSKDNCRSIEKMNFRNAIFIGIVQGIAVWPGLSRSGSTLFASIICKLEREFAVKFVFILSIPSILGSVILEVPDAIRSGVDVSQLGPVIVGMIVAAISGIFAIKSMVKIVSNKKLSYFSYYVWALAIVVIITCIF